MANPVPLDFRFPGIFNLNQTPKLPDKFGPPDMSGMLQSSLSAMADPIVSRMKEEQAKTSAKTFYEQLASLSQQNAPLTTPSSTPSSTAGTGAPGTGAQASADVHAPLAQANSEVRDTFMNTVKTGGLTNPYGLAAVAATGQAESGWSSGRVNSAWNDKGKPSGGLMSWRAERLQDMRNSTRGAEDPVAAQAQFLLKENPQLIAALNAAKSPEEANTLMANAWRYEGFKGGEEYQRRLALTRQYASQMAPAQAPQPAPAASFAPQVAPAPTPAAAATVTAPTAQQQPQQPQPQFTAPNVNMNDYAKAIAAAVGRGDKDTAEQLAQERDMVLAQQRGAQPQQAGGMPLPRRDGAQGGVWPGGQPQQPQQQPAAPGPQSQQAAPEQKQEAQQQQVIQTVGAATQQNADRLDGMRQEGERVRVASISPQLPGLGLGSTMPGAPQPPPQQAPQPQSPAMGEPSFFSPQPMVPPQLTARPATPAPSAPAAAPAGTTAGPTGAPPPAPPAVAPSPVQVAQAQGLPPQISEQRMRPITDAQARALFNAASTPEQYAMAAKMVMESRLPPAPHGDRFSIVHDGQGNWVRVDKLTGQVTPMSGAATAQKAEQTVEVETNAGKQRMQWNPATRRYDIPVGPVSPPGGVPEPVRKAERELFNDFESTETVKKYRELEQGVQGLKAAFTGGSAGADLVATIQLFKAIDPGSTVTQNEVASVKNAAGVPETLRALFNRGVGEGGQFSPELRAEIFNTAQRLQQGRVKQVEQHANAYRNRAKAYGLDPDRTVAFQPFQFEKAKAADFPDLQRRTEDAAPAAPPRITAPGSTRAAPVDVPSVEAAERMPAGTYFRLPNGKIGIIE